MEGSCLSIKNIHYKNLDIHFWSGTGNSYRIADYMRKTAEGNGLTTRIFMIEKSSNTTALKTATDSITGIVFPTHGFTAPWHILKFACRLPYGKSLHAFCAATRAGLKIGPAFIPGISGSAAFIVALIMLLKGYNVRGVMSVDMPSNWYSLHPIQSRISQEAIIDRARIKTDRFMDKILLNKKVWFTVNNLCEMFWGILLSLISIGYLFIGRFFLAKLFFANRNCDGCGVCADYCTLRAITMQGKTDPKPFWKYNCESCMRCSAFCPRNAVEAGHSWGVVLYFIAGVPASAYLFSWLSRYVPGVQMQSEGWFGNIINLLYYYPAIFISYFIFNALIRIPAVNWIFTHTTMTHLPFWGRYREPGTLLKNIAVRNKNAVHQTEKIKQDA